MIKVWTYVGGWERRGGRGGSGSVAFAGRLWSAASRRWSTAEELGSVRGGEQAASCVVQTAPRRPCAMWLHAAIAERAEAFFTVELYSCTSLESRS